MNRFFKIIVHLMVFAIGIPVVGFSDFWAWNLFQGLVLPILATGFFIYLILFIALGGYRVFQVSS
ncbi:MAG: hypothetical protein P8X90_11270 [Desulfobacterales bacterium]